MKLFSNTVIFVLSIVLLSFMPPDSFKTKQKKYARVRQAYTDKGDLVKKNLEKNNIDITQMNVYLQVFKTEQIIELWAKNKTDKTFKLIRTFDICASSGTLGPKRQQGDLQVPEGFYHINMFNPFSNFYLSLGVNYPNKSDRILGVKGNLGGSIFIHGNCVTIGCMPITDDKIKELYIYCVEAKNNGQTNIPVTIYPAKLTNDNFKKLVTKYTGNDDKVNLWTDLKLEYDFFQKTKTIPKITFLETGRHKIAGS